MIFHEVAQNSAEWFHMRQGLATSSCFDRIVTPAKAELSKSWTDYAHQLIGEIMTGTNAENFTSYWMERGAQYELEAAQSYSVLTGNVIAPGGFVTNDDMTYGASPDRRVIDCSGKVAGGVEIKCPSPGKHIGNFFLDGKIDQQYKPQVQGHILICGFEFVDWFSYHPDLPPALVRTYRDDEYCDKLEKALNDFVGEVEQKINKLRIMGFEIPERRILKIRKLAEQEASLDVGRYLDA